MFFVIARVPDPARTEPLNDVGLSAILRGGESDNLPVSELPVLLFFAGRTANACAYDFAGRRGQIRD